MTDRISPSQFHEAEGVEDRRVLGEGACAHFRTGSLEAGARLVEAIGELAALDAHHPDVDVGWTLADAEGNEADVCTWQPQARPSPAAG